MKTVHLPGFVEAGLADRLFMHLKENMDWQDGIYSNYKRRVTRKACALSALEVMQDEILFPVVLEVLQQFAVPEQQMPDVYLNYYRNGNDFTPSHTHKDSNQIVISLGCTRTLKIASKNYETAHGDVIFFGSSAHGVPEDDSVDARISIAMFCLK